MNTSQPILDAVIVGSGFGGLGAAAQLTRAGLNDFIVLERDSQLGGVWRDNTYPGAACDVQSILYCYSYFPHLSASKLYSDQAELLGYLHALATEFALFDHIRFGSEVVRALWDDAAGLWDIHTQAGDSYRARAFVPAWGQLGLPNVPDILGLDSFKGTMFHSARWDHSFDPAGLRVASVGNAASAVQYVPEIAQHAGHLTVFQRSANYVLPRGQEIFSAERRAQFQSDPTTFNALRTDIHEQREAAFARMKSGSNAQVTGKADAMRHLEAQIPDPALRAKLTPDYEFGCKRVLRSDDYYPALLRDNVELVTDGIAAITPTGIRTADGHHREFDAIVFGTGFRSQAFHAGMDIVGRSGLTLSSRWGEDPEAYFGLSVDGFPNMFLVYGPNTNLNHNSIVTMMEVQHKFIVDAVRRLRHTPGVALEVRSDVVAEHNTFVQERLKESSFSSECSSWYKNAAGRVVNNWYGTVDDYRQAVAGISPEAFVLTTDLLDRNPVDA